MLSAGPAGGNYNIQYSWTDSIPKQAFYGCNSLESVTFPNGMTTIGESAFCLCSSLTDLYLPDSAVNIGKSAFQSCSSLTNVILPANLKTIQSYAFMNCNKLENAAVPRSVTFIMMDVFKNTSSKFKMTVYPNSYAYDYAVENSIPFNIISVFGTPNYVLPEDTAVIGNSAFEGTDASIVFVPDDCESIGEHAFYQSQLTQIRIPAGCTIADDAFEGCADVTIFGAEDSAAESYCDSHANCVFSVEGWDPYAEQNESNG